MFRREQSHPPYDCNIALYLDLCKYIVLVVVLFATPSTDDCTINNKRRHLRRLHYFASSVASALIWSAVASVKAERIFTSVWQ